MKVIISSAFYESTIPLAKKMAETEDVTLISIHYNKFLSKPNFDLSGARLKPSFLYSSKDIPEDHYLRKYLSHTNLNLRFIIFDKNLYSFIKSQIILLKFVRSLSPKTIHFIDFSVSFLVLLFFNLKANIICSLHEFNELNFPIIKAKNFQQLIYSTFIKLLVNNKSKFLFFSENIRDKFIMEFPSIESKVVPFGLFEIYKYCDSNLKINHFSDYILFIGYGRKYKGLSILNDAIKQVNAKELGLKFVIAGKNISEFIDSDLKNTEIIDKHLTDDEFISLIKNSKALCLPYLKSSQSGIPNTCFLFNKPIICSDVKGLDEVIKDYSNGVIFKKGNSNSLAKSIILISTDDNFYNKLQSQIELENSIMGWESIASETIKFYKD